MYLTHQCSAWKFLLKYESILPFNFRVRQLLLNLHTKITHFPFYYAADSLYRKTPMDFDFGTEEYSEIFTVEIFSTNSHAQRTSSWFSHDYIIFIIIIGYILLVTTQHVFWRSVWKLIKDVVWVWLYSPLL